MKTEDILAIEESGENRINLVRDRLFWQAWNRSAFLFVTHIKKYQVHKRFVQKVAQEVAWLGFPKNALENIEKIAKEKGWTFEQKSADHIIIGGVPSANGYEKWWAGVIKPPKLIPVSAADKAVGNESAAALKKHSQLLAAYKTAYDLCLYIYKTTAKMSKEYRYELGARIRGYATDIMEELHLACNAKADTGAASKKDAILGCVGKIQRLRIDIRILHDLQEIAVKQWGFLNLEIEKLLDCLRAEFRDSKKIAGASLNQSGGTLPPAAKNNAAAETAARATFDRADEHRQSYADLSLNLKDTSAQLTKRFRYVSALPGGNRNSDGNFNDAGNNGRWWSSTENDGANA